MAFKQNFKNVGVVKNLDGTNKVSSESNSSGYEQDYENVKEVINLEYDSNAINDIKELISNHSTNGQFPTTKICRGN